MSNKTSEIDVKNRSIEFRGHEFTGSSDLLKGVVIKKAGCPSSSREHPASLYSIRLMLLYQSYLAASLV